MSLASVGISGLMMAQTAQDVVRMLVPGFTVEELPVRLSNQNNLRFAPDGTLTSLGYDGRVWSLKDTDGDGLEDRAEPFWDAPTLSVPLGMAWSTGGLYVSSKGKVSLLRDTDGDGRADREEIIASGWPATDVGSGGVDATAVTLDERGNVYFGLVVANYANAYRLRRRSELTSAAVEWLKSVGRWREPSGPDAALDEFSLYDPASPRGTIQKWDPRARRLETVATGLRVPVALAFNREGDLFNTDQEGETWMPNGNPLDELNHIRPGRHYGFPPRHERWLPDVSSEPPVVEFAPQHQSACGLVFNEPRSPQHIRRDVPLTEGIPLPSSAGQGLFGPSWWEGDALVAGQSRGKIWRVRLVKTPHGYVGRSDTIARLSMLTVDLTISPRGDLYVCCHSGPPDWGSGPQGAGRIFRIRYTDPKAPQPVAVWPSGPTEVRIAFDRPLAHDLTNAVQRGDCRIQYGEYLTAGWQRETLKPPYAVVEHQDASPVGTLAVRSVTLNPDWSTVILQTEPHLFDIPHAVTLGGIRAEFASGSGESVELEYSFAGLMVDWVRTRRDVSVTNAWWIPQPDFEVSRALLRGSLEHNRYLHWPGPGPGRLALRGRVNLPAGEWRLNPAREGSRGNVVWTIAQDEPVDGSVRHARLEGTATLWHDEMAFHSLSVDNLLTAETRPSLLSWFQLPWTPDRRISSGTDSRPPPKPDGDWEHGRELFAGGALNCVKCHRIRGEGGTVGPDLSNLVHRDARTLERDIRDPGATLHPDYVTYQVELKNGDGHEGFVRFQGNEELRLLDVDGRERVFPRGDVVRLEPAGRSLMPSGLLDGLKPDDVRDLLTFLMHAPPTPRRTEAEQILGRSAPRPSPGRPLRLVLVASKQDHGPGQHDYPRWQDRWIQLLARAGERAQVERAWEWPSAAQFQTADVVVFYFWNHDWSPGRYAELDAFQLRGGGVALIHSAVIADQDPEALAERIGLSAQPGRTGYRHMPFRLRLVKQDHFITAGLPETLSFLDEPYWPLVGEPARVDVLGVGRVDGVNRPLVWTFERGRGRVFGTVLGHFFWTLDDPMFRLLVLRGIAWAGRSEPDLLSPAVVP